MTKHRPRLSRCPFALLALTAALAAALAAPAQEPLGPSSIALAPSIAPADTTTDARLHNVESQLQQLLEADNKRQAEAKPTFQMGGLIHVDSVFIGDDLPELGADLVAALASLDVHDLTHSGGVLA